MTNNAILCAQHSSPTRFEERKLSVRAQVQIGPRRVLTWSNRSGQQLNGNVRNRCSSWLRSLRQIFERLLDEYEPASPTMERAA